MNMPPDVEARIRALPGNKICSDCNNINPQWASVSYGTLVCLECSGHHRSLGVHLSFVRSIQMDSWTPKQVAAMEQSGGNKSLVDFLASRGIDKNWPIAAKYNTKQAAYYKERLSRRLDGKTEPPPDPGRYDPVSGGDAQGAEPLPGETPEAYNARQARLREAAAERLRQKFGGGGMGGVGSSPNIPQNDDSLVGSITTGAVGLAGGALGLVGGAVGGSLSFLKNNVIENDDLHSSIKSAVGTAGETASGAWGAIRKSVADGQLVDKVTSQDGLIRKGFGSAVGTAGVMWEKASTGLGDLVSDGDADHQGQAQAPRCDMGHPLRTDVRPAETCALCGVKGTRYGCSRDCNYGVCTTCFERPLPRKNSSKGNVDFDDDEWGADFGGQEKAPPPVPTADDMNRLAQDLGMKLGNSSPAKEEVAVTNGTSGTNGKKAMTTTPAPAPSLYSMDLKAPAPAPKPKAKAKLLDEDDFFGEFGLGN
eukprot:CAMPEP_0172689700 /NCGR_PEP_ID=MMETSP1074-20121228/23334_1 /TAXON_ID=2916 /ORGANISM="Ceratium fusus, Strain PA161109" /LENGTH=478 /DNA_ID=CAMNT_0013509545 /DNA_START=59 /DNA_END=1495 /DNA_ORIENTATION=+